MDIREIQPKNTTAAESAQRAQQVGGASGSERTPEQGSADRVTMSNRAQDIQQARQAALAVPEVRQDRVEALRQQLANGSLAPDPNRIARALITQGVLS